MQGSAALAETRVMYGGGLEHRGLLRVSFLAPLGALPGRRFWSQESLFFSLLVLPLSWVHFLLGFFGVPIFSINV